MSFAARLTSLWPARRRAARASTVFADSTMARAAWDRRRRAAGRYGFWGALLGALVAFIAFAPAAWLASALASATGQRLLLADARGTVWSGSATVVLTGGPGSRDAAALPGRLAWALGLKGTALELRLRQACCLNGTVPLLLRPGLGRLSVTLPSMPEGIGEWPAAWLAGLGTPWNTLQLGGSLRLASPGATVESVQGRWRLDGGLALELASISSRLTTLDALGSYRADIRGNAAGGDTATLQLSTLGGPLQLSGAGQWAGPKFRFRGEAVAAEDAAAALDNLLNIIGRRQGARSIISIG
ncbi:MAG TPA: type II secretion system protein N [Rubrivivax sp.]